MSDPTPEQNGVASTEPPQILAEGQEQEQDSFQEQPSQASIDNQGDNVDLSMSLPEGEGSPRPTSRSTRIPKQSSRAAFTRTPSRTMGSGMAEEGEDDSGLHESNGVLITELQGSDAEERSIEEEAAEAETIREESPQEIEEERLEVEHEQQQEEENDVIDEAASVHVAEPDPEIMESHVVEVKVTDEDYDTDLDIEDEAEEEDQLRSYYKTVCDQLGLVPVEYFLRHIRNSKIRMRYRGLGPDATRAIALSLKDNINLERLDICGNWIGPGGAFYMSRLLEENDYITDVSMGENKIGWEGGLHVAKMMNLNGGLRRLDIGGNELNDKCVEAISSALENNKYLRELNLSHNQFTEVGAEYLGPAISGNENLDVLDLSWNHLRERGGIAVAKGLKENVRLKVCNLSWNGLDVKGGLAIADAMMANQSLLELDISGNRLTLDVATKMAKVLTTNDTIKILKMGNNLITSAGAIALASAINNTDNCELEELDLTDVPVEYEFLRTIEDIKTNRPNFKVKHGPLMRAGNTLEDIDKPAIDLAKITKEPVVILKEHIVVNDMRLLDILKRYDEEGSLSIAAEDFMTAVEELAVPYDKKALEDSVKKFAATATGKIYFGSFVPDEYGAAKKTAQGVS